MDYHRARAVVILSLALCGCGGAIGAKTAAPNSFVLPSAMRPATPPQWKFFKPNSPGGDMAYLWCMAAGADGRLWFGQQDYTDAEDEYVDAVATDGAISQYKVKTGAVQCTCRGPDGDVWATIGGQTSYIAQIAPNGKMTLFALPSGEVPNIIVTGPDKNLWFSQFNPSPGFIGRMTVHGARKEFPVTGLIQSMTPGPDRAVWFTEPYQGAIGRVASDGTIKYFSTGGLPIGITEGPDGNIWFTDAARGPAGSVARMSPNGHIVEYQIPGGPRFPVAAQITAGPDKKLYFVLGDSVGQIDVHGAMRFFNNPRYPRLGDGAPAFGPDGNLWIAWANTDVQRFGVVELVR